MVLLVVIVGQPADQPPWIWAHVRAQPSARLFPKRLRGLCAGADPSSPRMSCACGRLRVFLHGRVILRDHYTGELSAELAPRLRIASASTSRRGRGTFSWLGVLSRDLLFALRSPICPALPAQAAISVVLSGGGAHYISEEFAPRHGEPAELSAQESLKACFGAMGIYAVFLVFCGIRVYSMNSKAASKQLLDEE